MKTLFDIPAKVITHKNDPETSFEAAKKVVKKLSDKQKYVLRLIKNYCKNHVDFTPKEIAGGVNGMYFDIQRRKNELAAEGLIIATGVERGGCEVWRLNNAS